MFLSTFVKLHFQVQGLGVDYVFPLLQQQEEQEETHQNIRKQVIKQSNLQVNRIAC